MIRSGEKISVIYKSKPVGTLAETRDRKVAFQYDGEWVKYGFSISPFSLPLTNDVFIPDKYTFAGLFGVFADSLPDAWGRIVLDRLLARKGINPADVDVLDRLAIVGCKGKGALEYIPEYQLAEGNSQLTLDELSEECNKILSKGDADKIDELFSNCGSSGGARPKAMIKIDDEEWIVKFIYSRDRVNFGKLEYDYNICAERCGICIPKIRLIKTENGNEFFASKRFDRPKVHMISAAALLELDFERSLTDYSDLLKLTNIMTNGSKADIADMFRRMCFNVYSKNMDDHLKNFSFTFDDNIGKWKLSPAYDLTFCITGYGEHTTTVNGKGKDITDEDLLSVGIKAGLKREFCNECIGIIKENTKHLEKYYKM